LCQHAFTTRSTFYAYYQNIDELLEDIENELIYILAHQNSELMNPEAKSSDDFTFFNETMELVKSNRKVLYTLLVANPDYRFIAKWRAGAWGTSYRTSPARRDS